MTTIDLATAPTAAERTWTTPDVFWPALSAATARLDPAFGVLHLPALRHNTHDMLRRAAGKPIRVASKSVRVRSVLDAVLALPGYAGVLAYTLPEALWLAEGDSGHAPIEDVVVGYPTADRAAIARLAASPELASRVTLMVDSVAHLDLIDAVVPPAERETIRLCLELDSSWDAPVLGHIGVYRSPLHSVETVRAVAEAITRRPGFALVGMMGYEAQIAGQGDNPPGRPAWAATLRWMQKNSREELIARRGEAVAAVRALTGPRRRRRSRCRWCDGPTSARRRCSAAAGSRPARPAPTASRSSSGRPGCPWSTARWRGRCRRRSPAPPPPSCASATGSGCGTRSRASSAST